jgi:hypothetical protein
MTISKWFVGPNFRVGAEPEFVFQAQRFMTTHAAVQSLFNRGRHLVSAEHYRNLRESAFNEWSRAVA